MTNPGIRTVFEHIASRRAFFVPLGRRKQRKNKSCGLTKKRQARREIAKPSVVLYNGKHMKRQDLEDEDLSDKMRLDKLLALLGEGTRSEIKAMVRAGRVTVDGRALYYKAVRHVMLNKPSGVLTAARDKKQKTVMDLLPPMYAAMGAMGRRRRFINRK